jgi:flagellar hook-length control protein FliK
VERLDRTPGAGGRRKARRQEQEPDRRSQRGQRPEEARAERQAGSKTSRRKAEAQNRTQSGSDQITQVQKGAGSQQAEQSIAADQTAGSFESHLAYQELPESNGTPKLTSNLGEELNGDSSSAFAHLQNNLPQAQAGTLGGAGSKNAVALALGNISGSLRGSSEANQMLAAAPGATQVAGTKQKKTPSVPAAVVSHELSESQEAQRSSQVMRQLRMHLNPGMRSATVHLHPAELGRIQIKLRTANGEVHAVLRAESEEALAILERHIPELEAAFADQGYEQMSFDFVLDQQESRDPGAWNFDRDVSAELEARMEKQTGPQMRTSNLISDIGVDTFA